MDTITNAELDALQAQTFDHSTPVIRRLCRELRAERLAHRKLRETCFDLAGHFLPWPHCYETERSVLALIFFENMTELFEKLDAGHFFLPEHKFLFQELRLMHEAGEPLADNATCARWFTSPDCKKRLREAKVDFEADARVLAYLPGLGAGMNSYWSRANVGRYLKTLEGERLRRFLWRISLDVRQWDLADPRNPVKTLNRLQQAWDKAWSNISETHAEELNA